jgi:acyl dehydratase
MRMLAPVKIGDTIGVRVEIREQKTTRDPGKGVQTWLYTVLNQRNDPVMSFDYTMMFHLRGAGTNS